MVDVVRNPDLDERLEADLVEIWAAVSNAGGAVGFLPPVTVDEVRELADPAFARVREGRDDLAVAYDDGKPAGFGFLVTNEFHLHRHWATVKRLQRHPDRRGRAVGAAVLAELESAAADRGLERVVLTVRGGTGKERFYTTRGYRIDGRLPGRLKLGEGHVVDDLHLSKVIGGGAVGWADAGGGAVGWADSGGGAVGGGDAGGAPRLPVVRLDDGLPLPSYAHRGDAGLDLRAREDVRLEPGERAVVPTGLAMAIPEGHVGLVHPRSGLAAQAGLGLVNAPGTIDAGFRGEIHVILVNLDGAEPITLSRGDRIAQLVVQPVSHVVVDEVDRLPESGRGADGFGSTGA